MPVLPDKFLYICILKPASLFHFFLLLVLHTTSFLHGRHAQLGTVFQTNLPYISPIYKKCKMHFLFCIPQERKKKNSNPHLHIKIVVVVQIRVFLPAKLKLPLLSTFRSMLSHSISHRKCKSSIVIIWKFNELIFRFSFWVFQRTIFHRCLYLQRIL